MWRWTLSGAIVLAVVATGTAEAQRVASPPGAAATEVGGTFDTQGRYVGGRWIGLSFGRPIKRGRAIFGPPDFAQILNDGAPVWRAGANLTTQLHTELPLVIGTELLPPGTYTLFIELRNDAWTFIVSSWPAQERYDQTDRDALFGAFHYRPHKDVVRAPMTLERLPYSFDQLSWQFLDMSDEAGKIAIFWDDRMAWVPFQIRPLED